MQKIKQNVDMILQFFGWGLKEIGLDACLQMPPFKGSYLEHMF